MIDKLKDYMALNNLAGNDMDLSFLYLLTNIVDIVGIIMIVTGVYPTLGFVLYVFSHVYGSYTISRKLHENEPGITHMMVIMVITAFYMIVGYLCRFKVCALVALIIPIHDTYATGRYVLMGLKKNKK